MFWTPTNPYLEQIEHPVRMMSLHLQKKSKKCLFYIPSPYQTPKSSCQPAGLGRLGQARAMLEEADEATMSQEELVHGGAFGAGWRWKMLDEVPPWVMNDVGEDATSTWIQVVATMAMFR